MAILKFKNENGEWEAAETPGALKYTEQTLTESQKAQVKANLGITDNGSGGGGSGTVVYVGTDLSDNSLASGKGTLELAIGSERPWQVGDLYIDTVYNSIYRCTSYTTSYTYTWELIYGELLSSVHTGTELYDNSNGTLENNKVFLMMTETKPWNLGDLYVDTSFNAVFKCTDFYFRGYTASTWDLIADLGGNTVREFDYVVGFDWAQFLGEPTFIKVNFPEGREFYLYNTDADGDAIPGDPITPKTLFLNLSTEIGDDYKILHLETVVNGRPYKSAMHFNKDTNAVVMSSSTMSPVPDSYSKTDVDTKLKSKIAIYNNVKPSTFKWWEAINYALGNTTIDFSYVQTGAFQLNLASGCYFTGLEGFGQNEGSASVGYGDKLSSAFVNFTVSYYGGGCHDLVLSIEHNGELYRSDVYESYPGSGTEMDSETGYGFNIPDNIQLNKVAPTAMTNDEIDAICGVTILDASSGEVTF